MFLPSNTTLLIQILNQGIIYAFKSYCTGRSLQWILCLMELMSWKSRNNFQLSIVLKSYPYHWKNLKYSHKCMLEKDLIIIKWYRKWSQIIRKWNYSHIRICKMDPRWRFETIQDTEDLLMEDEIEEANLLDMASDAIPQIDWGEEQ